MAAPIPCNNEFHRSLLSGCGSSILVSRTALNHDLSTRRLDKYDNMYFSSDEASIHTDNAALIPRNIFDKIKARFKVCIFDEIYDIM